MLKKTRLAIDEDSPYLALHKHFGNRLKIVSVIKLIKRCGADDERVYQTCNDKNYHILTRNTRHFKKFLLDTTKRAGIICNEAVDFKIYFRQMQKLFKFFDSHEKFYDQFIKITGEKIEAINKRTKEKVIII